MLPRILLALVLFACAPQVFAARSMTISGAASSLSGDDILTVVASPSGFIDGEMILIKGAFFQSGTSNYFGYTKNNDVWIKNSGSNSTQRSVKIGEWDGLLQTKVDYGDSGYKGENDYSFKIRFYYGSSLTADWSTNELVVSISEPDPTITPQPTPTHVPTPTQILFSPTPVPTPSSTVAHTIIPLRTISLVTVTQQITPDGQMRVLGVVDNTSGDNEIQREVSSTSGAEIVPVNNLRSFSIALAFVASGFALLSIVAIWHNIKIWTVDTQNKKIE